MSWAIKYRNGSLSDDAWRTRALAMNWAGQRYIGSNQYRDYPLSLVWKLIKRRHGMRIVRVTLSEDGCP